MTIEYETRMTAMIVAPKGEPIFHETATEIRIVGHAAGEFVIVVQHGAATGHISVDPEAWPALRKAINKMVKECRE